MKYLIFDGRYHAEVDAATLLDICNTLKEAREVRLDYGNDTVIVAAKEVGKDKLIHTGMVE